MNNTTKKAMTSDKVVAYYTSQLDELYNNMHKDDFTWLKRWIALQMITTRTGANKKFNLNSPEKIFACLEKWIEISSVIGREELD